MKSQPQIVKIIPEVCRALRGDIPQSELNKKFNFKGNVISKWECGTRQLSWLEFIDLCKYTGHNIEHVLAKHYLYNGPLDNQVEFLEHICASISNDYDNFPIPGLRPSKIRNLLAGKDPLCLDEFFILMEVISEAMNFLTFLMGDQKIKSYLHSVNHYQQLLELAQRNYFIGPLFSWIAGHKEKPIPRTRINVLAEIFSIGQEELGEILKDFIRLGVVKYEAEGDFYTYLNLGLPNNSRAEDFSSLQKKYALTKTILHKRYLETKQRSIKDRSVFVFIPFPKGDEAEMEKILFGLAKPLGRLRRKAEKDENFNFLIFNLAYSVINLE